MASSVAFAVVGEVVLNRLRKSGLRLFTRRYDVEVSEEIRPDAQCGRCSGWGHTEVHGTQGARCALCIAPTNEVPGRRVLCG